jgi:hypothetical protein
MGYKDAEMEMHACMLTRVVVCGQLHDMAARASV